MVACLGRSCGRASTMLFADDTNCTDQLTTSKLELNIRETWSLMRWSADWQLRFNVSKCKVMHYGSRNPEFPYGMNPDDPEDNMVITKEKKDIGVIFTKDLKFTTHIAKAANKGTWLQGIRPSFRYMDKIR